MTNRNSTYNCVKALLKPLINFSLNNSLKIQDLTALIKQEFAISAKNWIQERGEEMSLSKISVMTGIPRKFIGSIIDNISDKPSEKNIIIKIVNKWQTDKRFGRGINKKPLPLDCEGNDSDFFKLVREISLDLNPYTIINELIRVGLAIKIKNKLSLNATLYIEQNKVESLNLAAQDCDTLFKVVEHNVNHGDSEKHLHLFTEYDNIPDEHLEEIRKWILIEGSKFQSKVNQYLSQYDRDSCNKKFSKQGKNKVRVVLYEFSEEQNE
jgi:hypothetical protein